MSSMTEDCDTGIYGVKPWTNQGVAPKPHNRKTPNPNNKSKHFKTHTHTHTNNKNRNHQRLEEKDDQNKTN